MPVTDIITPYRKITTTDGTGSVGLMHALVLNEVGELSVIAFAGDVSPEQIWELVNRHVGDPQVKEIIFGIDRWSKPGQGVDTSSLVTVYHYRRDVEPEDGAMPFRFGIIPYDENGAWPVIWDHPFWSSVQRREVEFMLRQTQDRTVRMLRAAGLPPEAHDELLRHLEALPRPATHEQGMDVLKKLVRKYGQ